MRKILLACAAVTALLSFSALAPQEANAMPPIRAGINVDQSLIQDAAYVCRRRCGPYGCARRCWWTGPGYGYGAYRPYRPYYRPYGAYRPYRYYR